jgi:hypothetical protein
MKILKWIGIVVLSLVVIIAACAAFVIVSGGKKAEATVEVTVAPVAIPTDPAAIERGISPMRSTSARTATARISAACW